MSNQSGSEAGKRHSFGLKPHFNTHKQKRVILNFISDGRRGRSTQFS